MFLQNFFNKIFSPKKFHKYFSKSFSDKIFQNIFLFKIYFLHKIFYKFFFHKLFSKRNFWKKFCKKSFSKYFISWKKIQKNSQNLKITKKCFKKIYLFCINWKDSTPFSLFFFSKLTPLTHKGLSPLSAWAENSTLHTHVPSKVHTL